MFSPASIMYLLHLLPLASLALALPHTSVNLKRSAACGAQEWAIQGFESFQLPANFTPAPGTPAPYNYTHLSFTWVDPNLNVSGSCAWLNLSGTGEVADGLSYPCGVSGVEMSYQYFGAGTLELQETPVACDNATYTLGGGTTLSLECYEIFGGQSCETVTQVNVPISFLEQI